MNTVTFGAVGDDVARLQELLNTKGASLKIDRHFGHNTLVAVKNFQKSQSLTPDGVVGPNTWLALGVGTQAKPIIEAKVAAGTLSVDSGQPLGNLIVSIASSYIGLMEVRNNAAWADTKGSTAMGQKLRLLMEQTGWQAGWAYCAAFVEAVWRQALAAKSSPAADIFAKNMTPGVLLSFNNFDSLRAISRTPEVGAVMFMQNGSTSQGHAGIVAGIAATGLTISTIEGNTSPAPGSVQADREGDGIYAKTRPVTFRPQTSGLWLRGFLNPSSVASWSV